MHTKVNIVNVLLFALLLACSCKSKRAADEPVIVTTPEQMDEMVTTNLRAVLQYAGDNQGNITDKQKLSYTELVGLFYQKNEYKALWSSREMWHPIADSMLHFIRDAREYGLYPKALHFTDLDTLMSKLSTDSLTRIDAMAWTKADLLLSDAFIRALRELKEGRLVADSLSIIYKKNYQDSFFIRSLLDLKNGASLASIMRDAEPENGDYWLLRNALKVFAQKMDTAAYIKLSYPYKDSLAFITKVYARLRQSGYGDSTIQTPDSLAFDKALRSFQVDKKMTVDGIAGPGVVRKLNNTDRQKFRQIAITLDRYKQLAPLPSTYIWVNVPSFWLKVWANDEWIIESKIIVGKSSTPTPLFNSAISDMVTYPQWTMPMSIIRKDILPQLKKDPGYLERKGFSLVSYEGETINPFTVDWSKYNKGIPWKVVQGSGDDNALGVFKFNFNNPYSVYLHDTNQRYLFKNANRALSHGCVRVEKWQDLAFYIASLDSMLVSDNRQPAYNADSIRLWIANKDRKRIMVKSRLPLFIKYFTCEGKNDEVIFYDDIYKNDEYLADKYFAYF